VASHSIFSGPLKHSGKIFNVEKCVRLHLDKVHFHKNNTLSVYHFVLFIYFAMKSKGLRSSVNSPLGT